MMEIIDNHKLLFENEKEFENAKEFILSFFNILENDKEYNKRVINN